MEFGAEQITIAGLLTPHDGTGVRGEWQADIQNGSRTASKYSALYLKGEWGVKGEIPVDCFRIGMIDFGAGYKECILFQILPFYIIRRRWLKRCKELSSGKPYADDFIQMFDNYMSGMEATMDKLPKEAYGVHVVLATGRTNYYINTGRRWKECDIETICIHTKGNRILVPQSSTDETHSKVDSQLV